MEKKGFNVSYMGSIMSIYSVSNLIASLFMTQILRRISKKNLIILNCTILSISQVFFSVLMQMDIDESEFLLIVHFLRALQGITLSSIYALVYSMTLKLFDEQN